MDRTRGLLGLFLIFLLLLAAGLVVAQSSRPRPVYDPAGKGPDGLLLLREWLAEMGYAVGTTGVQRFALAEADLLFVYPGPLAFTRAEGEDLLRWVEAGGTLALVDADDPQLTALFDFSTRRSAASAELHQSQPLLPDAPAVITGTTFARRLRLADDFPGVVLLADESSGGRPAVAVLRQEKGWVWLLSEDFLLTNDRLTDSRATGQIVPGLLRAVPRGGRVLFDTYHLQVSPPETADTRIGSLQAWAYTTPSGWAVLFLFVLGFAFLLLQGRRLGPPVPTLTQGRRREAAEFVVAMAGLQRRAGVRDNIARHLRHRLKERLGRPWQLPADTPDREFLARLSATNPSLDGDRLAHFTGLLAELAANPDEARLVALARQVDEAGTGKQGTTR